MNLNEGVLVYIVPFSILKRVEPFFRRRCKSLTILSFPYRYYWNFKQVVVMCVKGRPRRDEALRNREIFESAIGIGKNSAPDELPTTADAGLVYEIPAGKEKDDDLLFRSFRLDPEVMTRKGWVTSTKNPSRS